MTDITEKMERAFAELPRLRKGPFYSRIHSSYGREEFINSLIAPNVMTALHNAREAQQNAVSYRDFNVGAAIVGLTRAAGWLMMPGINAKTNPDGPLNMHAEQLALRTARYEGADMISIVAVVGETQTDQQSGHEMHTLHPCGLCRAKLSDDPLVDNDATLIFNALPSLRVIEAGTVNALHAYHHDEDPDPSGITLFELPEMEILTPFTPPVDGVVRLEDNERLWEEERVWNATIGAYLIEHQQRLRALGQKALGINAEGHGRA